jgi:LuxR family maltose regulon positive regulatory protein
VARSTPQVQGGTVRPQPAGAHGAVAIAVGTPAWYAWLERTPAFAFAHAGGSFTARKERRRGGRYWYAYQRRRGKLHSAYLGKTEELTLARLEVVARSLAGSAAGGARGHAPERIREAAPPAQQPRETAPPMQHPALLATKLALPPARSPMTWQDGLRQRDSDI